MATAGVLNTAVFGAVWTAAGTGGIDSAAGVVVLALGWVLAAVLIVGSVRLRKRAEGLLSDDSSQVRRKHTLRRFNLAFGLELVAIVVAIFLLIRLGSGSLIPSIVVLIVGIHFFPLAVLFKISAYHLTGGVLCILALLTMAVMPEFRLVLAGLGSAVTLFATSAYMLFLGGKVTRAQQLKG